MSHFRLCFRYLLLSFALALQTGVYAHGQEDKPSDKTDGSVSEDAKEKDQAAQGKTTHTQEEQGEGQEKALRPDQNSIAAQAYGRSKAEVEARRDRHHSEETYEPGHIRQIEQFIAADNISSAIQFADAHQLPRLASQLSGVKLFKDYLTAVSLSDRTRNPLLLQLYVRHSQDVTHFELKPDDLAPKIDWHISGMGDYRIPYACLLLIIRNSKAILLHRGDELPETLKREIRNCDGIRYLRQSSKSPKKTNEEFVRAAKLVDIPLGNDNTKVFDGLPQTAERSELQSMGLSIAQSRGWRDLRDQILTSKNELAFELIPASKSELLSELKDGNSNVIVLIAHNQNRTLYLSGKTVERITMRELENLKREVAPHRQIMLITCKAGYVNQNTESLAELLLKNNLAEIVYASPYDLDARDIPSLLREFSRPHANSEDILDKKRFTPIVIKSKTIPSVLRPS
jgi:hypothetical protein